MPRAMGFTITDDMIKAGVEALQKSRASGLDPESTVTVIYQAMQQAGCSSVPDADDEFIPEDYDFETVL